MYGGGIVHYQASSKAEQKLLAEWKQPAESILIHELTHAYDDDTGNWKPYMIDQRLNKDSWYKDAFSAGRTGDLNRSLSEARAVMVQNQIAND
jgi:hypothetical protein